MKERRIYRQVTPMKLCGLESVEKSLRKASPKLGPLLTHYSLVTKRIFHSRQCNIIKFGMGESVLCCEAQKGLLRVQESCKKSLCNGIKESRSSGKMMLFICVTYPAFIL